MKRLKIAILGFLLGIVTVVSAQKKTSVALLNAKAITVTGDTIVLSDTLDTYKQEVVLVDYWASWCRPCVGEMPYSKDLQKQFAGKSVVFLYLSVDKNNEAWKRGLDRIQIPGLHFRLAAETKPAIQQTYRIKGIPFYQILAKNLVLWKNNTLWPHEQKLAKLIEKQL